MTVPLKLSQYHVLIADDHDPIRKGIKRILSRMGIKVIQECYDGKVAFEELEKKHYDLILCDIYMNKVSGFEVLQYVRSRSFGSDVPFIIVTGESNREDIVKASDLGATDYIIKPFQPQSVESKVTQALTSFVTPTPLLQALRQGDKLMLSKDVEGAQASYKKALDIDITSLRAKHSLAYAFFLLGNEEEAIKLLRKTIEESPSYYRSYATLADIYLQKGALPSAVSALAKELELNPKQPHRQITLANIYLKQEDIFHAIRHYRLALKDNPKNKVALYGLAKAYWKSDDLEKSLQFLKRVRRHDPDEEKALENLLKYCLSKQDPKRAEAQIKEEIRYYPQRTQPHLYLAKLFLVQDKMDDAIQALQGLFKISQDNLDGLRLLAAIHMTKRAYDEAFYILHKIESKVSDVSVYFAKGECLFHLGKYQEAIFSYHQGLVLKPHHPKGLTLCAQAYSAARDPLKAYFSLQLAKKFGNESQDLEKDIGSTRKAVMDRRKRIPSTPGG